MVERYKHLLVFAFCISCAVACKNGAEDRYEKNTISEISAEKPLYEESSLKQRQQKQIILAYANRSHPLNINSGEIKQDIYRQNNSSDSPYSVLFTEVTPQSNMIGETADNGEDACLQLKKLVNEVCGKAAVDQDMPTQSLQKKPLSEPQKNASGLNHTDKVIVANYKRIAWDYIHQRNYKLAQLAVNLALDINPHDPALHEMQAVISSHRRAVIRIMGSF